LIRDIDLPTGLLELAEGLIESAGPQANGADHDQ
jgi:hypothetical protein